jgi:hypothetical protein
VDDESLPFIQRLRNESVLSERDWQTITGWAEDARTFLAGPDHTVETDSEGELVINADADPRNADWLEIVRVRRLTRHRIPDWAALWLWWLAHKRGPEFWSHVARLARSAGIQRLSAEAKLRRPAEG